MCQLEQDNWLQLTLIETLVTIIRQSDALYGITGETICIKVYGVLDTS
jgi:hypothetical protein